MFKLEFSTENAVFHDENIDAAKVVADIIHAVASHVENGICRGIARDANGNTIGNWALSEVEP